MNTSQLKNFAADNNALIIKNLCKSCNKRKIVDDVSIKITTNSIVGLLGPNGAGKTSCFYIIVGLINCDSGSINLGTKDLTYLPMHKRSLLGIGYLPQESSVFRKLTVTQNILAILEIVDQRNSIAARKQRLEFLLQEFRLTHLSQHLAMQLSGGERRRLEIARTIAINPKFILLDEPFAGVDPISISEIKKILKKLSNNNIGILITDHNVRETLNICNTAYVMNGGKLIAEGGISEIINNPKVKEVYLGKEFVV